MPPLKVSGGRSCACWLDFKVRINRITAVMHRAITRNTDAAFQCAISTPAIAGPNARAALVAMPFSDTAAGTSLRGNTSTMVTIHADIPNALPVPRTKVSKSSVQAPSSPL